MMLGLTKRLVQQVSSALAVPFAGKQRPLGHFGTLRLWNSAPWPPHGAAPAFDSEQKMEKEEFCFAPERQIYNFIYLCIYYLFFHFITHFFIIFFIYFFIN